MRHTLERDEESPLSALITYYYYYHRLKKYIMTKDIALLLPKLMNQYILIMNVLTLDSRIIRRPIHAAIIAV